jgi:hypothetical protein
LGESNEAFVWLEKAYQERRARANDTKPSAASSSEPESQSRVEQLVQEALELAEEQRSEFLERRCTGDKHLRAEVESLLAYEKDAHSFSAIVGLSPLADTARKHAVAA